MSVQICNLVYKLFDQVVLVWLLVFSHSCSVDGSVSRLVHHFTHSWPQRMTPGDLSDPLSFLLAPPWGWFRYSCLAQHELIIIMNSTVIILMIWLFHLALLSGQNSLQHYTCTTKDSPTSLSCTLRLVLNVSILSRWTKVVNMVPAKHWHVCVLIIAFI